MTLIEVLVAVSILGIMGMLAYGSLTMTLKSQRRASDLQERYHTARVMMERLKRELSMAFVSLHQAEDQRTQTLFKGESDAITFTTAAHEPILRDAHQSDQIEVEYRLDRVKGERVVVRRVKYHVDDRPGQGGREEVAAVGIKDLEFSYYDKADEDWRGDWDVRIEDAEEKRVQLKAVRAMATNVKAAVEAQAGQGLAADATNTVAEGAVDKMADAEHADLMEGLFLPNRVKIRVTLVDDQDEEHVLETQAEIHMTEPLWY
jgi:type II secretion system protein J